MSLQTKILITIGSIITFGLLSIIIFQQFQISNRQIQIEQNVIAQKELVDKIVRSQEIWATKKDLESFVNDNGINLKAIQEDLSKLRAELVAANTITANSKGQNTSNIPSTNTGNSNPNPTNADPYGYQLKQQNLEIAENFGNVKVPIGEVGFSAWQQNPWNLKINDREYNISNVVGIDENKRLYFYNKFSLKTNNKSFDIPITSAKTVQEFPSAKFSLWNPRLFLTAGAAINLTETPLSGSFNAGGTIGFMSYGRYKPNPAISIGQIGLAYQSNKSEVSAIINPININIGGILPSGLMENTYLGPSVQLATSGNVFTGINLSVGF